jgi:hypothetical protein
MKKILLLTIIFLPILAISQKRSKTEKLIPVIAINKKIELLNPRSIINTLGDISKSQIKDEEQTRVYLLNSNKKVCLTLYHLSGGNKNSYSEFEISNTSCNSSASINSSFQDFIAGNIKLGISIKSVIREIGGGYKKIKTENTEILTYEIDCKDNNFLQKNNMPVYSARYTFKNGKLINIRFGFPNL